MNNDRDALKQRIRESNDIVEVIGGYIQLVQRGPTHKGICPFHNDHRPSFDVDPRRQRYRCWSCGEHGDVFEFVQKFEKVTFREALELLARRAGISLENLQKNPQGPSRAGMLDVMRWAGGQFQRCLFDSPIAENARDYLGERQLTRDTIRKFELGFAPALGDWLVQKALNDQIPAEMLETVGLIAKRNEGRGYYDRFRDRVIFPIRDVLGRIVGFGGRILPSSPVSADRPPPKYYNSAETSLFSKSDQLYGIDHAKQAAAKAGYLAVVEGYTDVLMAHQHGIGQVVATMGTALNERHIKKLKGITQRVVLVFDADAGGEGGVDRAMQVFVTNDLDLRVAALPDGLDPCDLLSKHGPAPFQKALDQAVDVFEHKLNRVWARHAERGLDGKRQAAEEMLGILALTPAERSVKLELMVNRIAHRLSIKEETVWMRLRELRGARKQQEPPEEIRPEPPAPGPQAGPALLPEKELLELLLAEPDFVSQAAVEIVADEIVHPGLRKIAEALYRLHAEGQTPDLDRLQGRLDNDRLWEHCRLLQDRGLDYTDRPDMFQRLLQHFRHKRERLTTQDLIHRIKNERDPAIQMTLMRQLQDRK